MKLLVFRLSAMGDVALTLPALRGVIENNPALHITLVTRRIFRPFFEEIPRCRLITPDLNEYKGITGLYRLFRFLKKEAGPDAVADLHDVLRTKVLRFFFRLAGTPVYFIDKGRKEKRRLVKGKIFRPLKHTVERYRDVFRRAGLQPAEVPGPWLRVPREWQQDMEFPGGEAIRIGMAPCARHALKSWPPEKMIRLMRLIREERPATVFYLFGGPEERETLEEIASAAGGDIHITLRFSLAQQLALMQQMTLMVTMDSANMHLAALLGVPVISIWGATHPYAGFSPWGADERRQVQISKDELSCRPCTVYGKGPCRRGDLACLQRITPERVWDRMKDIVMS